MSGRDPYDISEYLTSFPERSRPERTRKVFGSLFETDLPLSTYSLIGKVLKEVRHTNERLDSIKLNNDLASIGLSMAEILRTKI